MTIQPTTEHEIVTLETLDANERMQLATHEQRIEELFQQMTMAGALIGTHLRHISEGRLYRETAQTFEEYVQARWQKGRQWAYNLIAAAKVLDALSSGDVNNCLQISESHLRPLAPLRDDPDALRETWERANEIAEAEGKERTARHVAQAVAERAAPPPTDADDDWYDEPLTPHEAQIAAAYVAPQTPTPVEPEPAKPAPMAVHFSSATPEWYTPQHIIERVREFFGGVIDLDPCSNSADPDEANVPARVHFDKEIDGLAQSWRLPPHLDDYGDESHAVRAYVNPPYGRELPAWTDRVIAAYESGEITEAILLVPGRPGSEWWKRLRAYPVCLPYGRVIFEGADNSAPFPSAIFYLGSDVVAFRDIFGGEDFGEVREVVK